MVSLRLFLAAALAVAPSLALAGDMSAASNDCDKPAVSALRKASHWGQHKHGRHSSDLTNRFSRFWQWHKEHSSGWSGSNEWSWATTITYGGEAAAGKTAVPVQHETSISRAAATSAVENADLEAQPRTTTRRRTTTSRAAPTTLRASKERKVTSRPPVTTTRVAHTISAAPPKTTSAGGSGSTGAAGSVQKVALDAHNEFRAKHGVSALTWSNELASAAQAWADKCVFEHGGGKAIHAGENLAAGTGLTVESGIQMWYNEVGQYDFDDPSYNEATGHFTQLVWKGTTEVGCALSTCSPVKGEGFSWNGNFLVCEYKSPGNIVGFDATGTAKSFGDNVLAALS
ncbi:uncharacterized protein JCM10292_007377 [Rhodotorula paludigena]|uniref:uncharacterized protein n=1 Tax=Rhodotorula paludigena TaxID=86838 RepID=UPI00317C3FA6